MPGERAFEVIIVGGGIAGASLAYFLSERGMTDILLLEREPQPGYHATGRSAASLVEWDPIPALQQLKTQSAPFLRSPPVGFSEHPLLDPTGILVLFQEPLWGAVCQLIPLLEAQGTVAQVLAPPAIVKRFPVISPEHFDGGVLLPEDGRLDVHGLLWSYLRHTAERGAQRRCGIEVLGVLVQGGCCHGVVTNAGEFHARWVVNAAGAWAGKIGASAGAGPIPLTPHRRTIVTFGAPDGFDVSHWPLIANESHHLYFAPESGGLLASPMDEDPTEPCDAQPDELRVAEAIDRLAMLAPGLVPKTLRRKWAGLRTFASDRVHVVGEDPRVKGFFWLAGQGGCGIETSPAVGRIAADLLLDGRTANDVAAVLTPKRFEPA
ncbi:MAG: NAD(P)/FAD-dependent oxidoreductase [Candidatus Binatia bacterium]